MRHNQLGFSLGWNPTYIKLRMQLHRPYQQSLNLQDHFLMGLRVFPLAPNHIRLFL